LASLAAAALTAGCGGDSGSDVDTTTSGRTLSKSEWIARADAICAPSERKVDRAVDELLQGPDPSQAELDHYATEVLAPTVQGDIDRIRALPPPEGDEEEVTRILDSAQEGVDQLEAEGGLIQAGGGPFSEANLLAGNYGLRTCGWV
jgi:hypothetical protein